MSQLEASWRRCSLPIWVTSGLPSERTQCRSGCQQQTCASLGGSAQLRFRYLFRMPVSVFQLPYVCICSWRVVCRSRSAPVLIRTNRALPRLLAFDASVPLSVVPLNLNSVEPGYSRQLSSYLLQMKNLPSRLLSFALLRTRLCPAELSPRSLEASSFSSVRSQQS
ncbi:protein of unknown function [Bradyrhizobium vignae]|uniref:Uncharacterized protein n=1 Tax=Bradyrhizobium vignae TaxID=1549949 RepID=A0A2U3PVA8_9BRAD|nr:protein of unknown function [Bradyrhizobium vignae]